MIASVTGEVRFVGATQAVVEVSGFGIEVQASPHTLAGLRTGAPCTCTPPTSPARTRPRFCSVSPVRTRRKSSP
ncbi:OB-fold domain-containing protein [Kocuria atrinae]|uniref:OB-fold domain-containing protein n=1 Tax=Kocuria atrinae TaxID=592377 RepID=UPI002942E026|nr:OB-fold domain-containing protein [Kocuria atrinae]